MTTHTRVHDLAEARESRTKIAAHIRVLGLNGETARCAVHGRAGILHAFGHVLRHFVRAVRFEGAHAEAIFCDLRRFAKTPLGERVGDLLKRLIEEGVGSGARPHA